MLRGIYGGELPAVVTGTFREEFGLEVAPADRTSNSGGSIQKYKSATSSQYPFLTHEVL